MSLVFKADFCASIASFLSLLSILALAAHFSTEFQSALELAA
jgi:hypothetical protein